MKRRTVLIVDDMIDLGETLEALKKYCEDEGAEEVLTVVLVDKNRERSRSGLLEADFVGLKIPNKFIIGSGLDYEGYFRNMPGIFLMPEDRRL